MSVKLIQEYEIVSGCWQWTQYDEICSVLRVQCDVIEGMEDGVGRDGVWWGNQLLDL